MELNANKSLFDHLLLMILSDRISFFQGSPHFEESTENETSIHGLLVSSCWLLLAK